MGSAGNELNSLLEDAGLAPLDPERLGMFELYLALLLRWNSRTNLTAIRDREGILRRHFVESIAAARSLPPQLTKLVDFGSGAGFPGIPIALCRPEISVTLAESQAKKAGFLREAVRTLGVSAQVHSGRAELLETVFDCVSLRAVDRMEAAVAAGAGLLIPGGWLALLTTASAVLGLKHAAGEGFSWEVAIALPGSQGRVLLLGRLGAPRS